MSILPQFLAAATADLVFTLLLLGFTAAAIVLIVRLRVLRPASVLGPPRVVDKIEAGGVAIIFFGGLCLWILTQGVYASHVQAQWRATGRPLPQQLEQILTPRDYAVLSTLPALVGFVALLLGDRLIAPRTPQALGFTGRQFRRGVASGFLAMVCIGPIVVWVMFASEALYRHFHYQHPAEHELLTNLHNATDVRSTALLLVGAVVAAPVFEEYLFRGHLQTLVRHALTRMTSSRSLPHSPAPGLPGDGGVGGSVPADLPELAAPVAPNPQPGPPPEYPERGSAWPAWVAILLTSALFALVHPSWTWPPIFALSLGLGYVYERTGNLWAPITVHLLFNALSTVQFVYVNGLH